MIQLVKVLHILCAVISISGFVYRCYLRLTGSAMLSRKWLKISPHIIDTLLLASGLVMLFHLRYYPTANNWMAAKLTLVLVYIVLGFITLRFTRDRTAFIAAFIAALLCYTYIIGIALTKSVWPIA